MPLWAATMINNLKKILPVVISAILTAVFIVVLFFTAPQIASVPDTEGEIKYSISINNPDGSYYIENKTAVIGKDVTAVRISDLGRLNKLDKVNYVADKFLPLGALDPDVQIVDLTKPFEFAEKGTLIFIVMNLDGDDKDFVSKSEKLSDFKIGEHWHFTLSLPKIFNASNVYNKSELIARNGDIENYKFINYSTSYDKMSERYSPKVKRTNIDLKFYTRRQALNQYQMITIHYQSSGTVYSGIADSPFIGTEEAVVSTCEVSQSLLIVFAIFALIVFLVLIVLSLLKRTHNFIYAILWIFGISLILLPKYVLGQATVMPLLWLALSYSSSFITLGGALFAIGRNIGKFPAKWVTIALMAVGGVLAVICPFIPHGAFKVLRTVYLVLKALGSVAILFFVGMALYSNDETHSALNISTICIIAIASLASVFITNTLPVYNSSIFWLCALVVITTFVGVFKVFNDTEKANAYLTANLNLEVARQLKDITAVIAERDNLLRFVSHDMKKPLQSSATLIDTLIDREKDTEQIKALQIVKQNNSHVISNLSEVGDYARFNYIAEPSQNTNLYKLCDYIYEFHKPDCEANGINLINTVDKHYKVFVKRQGLENALSNVILNAVEHSNCKTITISAKTVKDRVVISVTDDGKGITEGIDVFGAYVSEAPGTRGVGLFICRNIIEAMNGELTYESVPGNTTFHFSLLKA